MKKVLPWIAVALLAITLIVVVAFVFLQGQNDPKKETSAAVEKKLTADEIVEVSSEITGIKTNLAGNNTIVQVNVVFEMKDAKAKEDFEKIKELVVKPIIIQAFADTQPEELDGAERRSEFNKKLTKLINEALPEPNLTNATFNDFIVAPM